MNDPRYRNPAQPSNRNTFVRDPRGDPDEPPSEFEEEFDPRPPRRSRDPGSAPGERPRPPRSRDESNLDFERRPPHGPRDPGMPPHRPRYPDEERPGRSMGRPEGRENWSGPRNGPDDGAGMRPRRPPRQSGKPPARRKALAPPRLRARYRYGALVGIMLFAAIAGICLGFSGIGGHSASVGLILAAVPALLASIGCAAVYVYF